MGAGAVRKREVSVELPNANEDLGDARGLVIVKVSLPSSEALTLRWWEIPKDCPGRPTQEWGGVRLEGVRFCFALSCLLFPHQQGQVKTSPGLQTPPPTAA